MLTSSLCFTPLCFPAGLKAQHALSAASCSQSLRPWGILVHWSAAGKYSKVFTVQLTRHWWRWIIVCLLTAEPLCVSSVKRCKMPTNLCKMTQQTQEIQRHTNEIRDKMSTKRRKKSKPRETKDQSYTECPKINVKSSQIKEKWPKWYRRQTKIDKKLTQRQPNDQKNTMPFHPGIPTNTDGWAFYLFMQRCSFMLCCCIMTIKYI